MPSIFISYRRSDSEVFAGRIYDRLVDAFGEVNVFKDVQDIQPGSDFRGVLREATAKTDVVLVLIGEKWLDVRDNKGKRRLDDPDDWVRIEVETGLQRDRATVIPVLLGNASMPPTNKLPAVLRELAYKNAVKVRNDPDFRHDMEILIGHLRGVSNLSDESYQRKSASWLSHPSWQGVAGIIALIALFVAILQLPQVQQLLNAPTPTQTLTDTPPAPTMITSTNTLQASLCTVEAFTILPEQSEYSAGTVLSLYGRGVCEGGIRASRFNIDGEGYGEDASASTQGETWTVTEGKHTICFEIAYGDWSLAARQCAEITGTVAPTSATTATDTPSQTDTPAATDILSSTPSPSNIPVAATPPPTGDVTLRLQTTRDSFTLIVVSAVNLNGLGFGVAEATGIREKTLTSFFDILQLTGGEAQAGDCYVLVRDGAAPPLSSDCATPSRTFKRNVAPADVFWYDSLGGQLRDVAIYQDSQPAGQVCSAAVPECEIRWN